MSGKVTLSGPFLIISLTLQPFKLALALHYQIITACHLILQGSQAFPLSPDLMYKAIRISGGGARVPRGAELTSRARLS